MNNENLYNLQNKQTVIYISERKNTIVSDKEFLITKTTTKNKYI